MRVTPVRPLLPVTSQWMFAAVTERSITVVAPVTLSDAIRGYPQAREAVAQHRARIKAARRKRRR